MPKVTRHFPGFQIRRAREMRKLMTQAETLLWDHIRNKQLDGLSVRRQHPVGPYIADFVFVSVGLVIEVDGEVHTTDDQVAVDSERDRWMREHNFQVLRFTNAQVQSDIENVIRLLKLKLATLHSKAPSI